MRLRVVCGTFAFAGVLLLGGAQSAAAITHDSSLADCDDARQILGLCGSNDGSSLEIIGSESTDVPGSSPRTDGGSGSSTSPPTWADEQAALWRTCVPSRGTTLPDYCATLRPIGTMVGGPADPVQVARTITITDLARFVPSSTTVAGEPDNVAVVGLPANFVSSATTETMPGTILGRALTIRFTPVNYAFDYGDGERRDSATAGASWDASGQAQFTPTGTSHVYKMAGRYTATVTVTYAADIDLGSGWIPINGTLNGPPASQEIRVVKARTALVQGTCQERPSAPGC